MVQNSRMTELQTNSQMNNAMRDEVGSQRDEKFVPFVEVRFECPVTLPTQQGAQNSMASASLFCRMSELAI